MSTDDVLARVRAMEAVTATHGASIKGLEVGVEQLDKIVSMVAPLVRDASDLRAAAERLTDAVGRLEKRADVLEKEAKDGRQEWQQQFDDWESDREQRRDRSRGFYLAAAAATIALAGLVVAILTYAHHP